MSELFWARGSYTAWGAPLGHQQGDKVSASHSIPEELPNQGGGWEWGIPCLMRRMLSCGFRDGWEQMDKDQYITLHHHSHSQAPSQHRGWAHTDPPSHSGHTVLGTCWHPETGKAANWRRGPQQLCWSPLLPLEKELWVLPVLPRELGRHQWSWVTHPPGTQVVRLTDKKCT